VEGRVIEEAAMAIATSTVVRYQDPVEVRERAAVAGLLAGYTGHTRLGYTTDLRLFTGWCAENRLRLLQAGLGSARDHALISLLAMNGLRISEALGADMDDVDVDRGHRTLRVTRKGGKQVTIPLAPGTAPALDLYIGERTTGPMFPGAAGGQMDRFAADRTVKRLARGRGSPSGTRRTACATASSPPRRTPVCRYATSKKRPATPTRARRCATTGPPRLRRDA
jgi:integrase